MHEMRRERKEGDGGKGRDDEGAISYRFEFLVPLFLSAALVFFYFGTAIFADLPQKNGNNH